MRPGMRTFQLKSQCGQAMILVAIALPLFFAIALLVVDGSRGFVQKRQMQNAADAAALAAARDLKDALGTCDAVCMSTVDGAVAATASRYSADNGGPSPLVKCDAVNTTNCYTWPYKGLTAKVEVRLRSDVETLFTNFFGYAPGFLKAGARAVGSAEVANEMHCRFDENYDADPDNDVEDPDQYLNTTPPCVIPGRPAQNGTPQDTSAHCLFNPPVENPDQYVNTTPQRCTTPNTGGIPGATALAMSRECDAISYTGAGGGTIGTVVTNGGVWFQGNAPKRIEQLAYDQPGCPDNPARPPSGTSQCDNATPKFLCAEQLFDFSDRAPINWPVPPPPEPTPLPSGTTWDPSIHYPSRCIDLGAVDRSFATSNGPPGIYCLRGGATLTLNVDFTAGDGYTFFALGGGKIANAGARVKFYWPSACGARPTDRELSFTCFGRTISGYDPQTLFYATNTVHDPADCSRNAICISGGTSKVDGDMFAVAPTVFPPPDRSP